VPEGHVVHRLARRTGRAFAGSRPDVSSPQGRFAEGAALVDRRAFVGADAYGKHLIWRFDGDLAVHVHLGLYGKVTVGTAPPPPVVGEVRLRMESPEHYLDLRGPSACELYQPADVAALLDRLGPDPIRRDADPERAWLRVHRSRAPIAGLLMHQHVISGVGNIYRAEVLFRAGVAPMREGRALGREPFDRMWTDLVHLMRAGVRSGRIDTVRPEHEPETMGRPPRVDRHGGEVYVYRRAGQPCHVCGTRVRVTDLAGRHLYWCPRCQRR
jgi:endonuclease VIII